MPPHAAAPPAPFTRAFWRRALSWPRTAPTSGEADEHVAFMFHRIAMATVLLVAAVMPIVIAMQPAVWLRAVTSVAVVGAVVLVALALNTAGRTRPAVWCYIAGVLTMVTANAIPYGGIRSPGVQGYLVFSILAGILLGERAGMRVAGISALITLALVVAEHVGMLPEQQIYSTFVRWTLGCMYLGFALFALHLAADTNRRALARARREMNERRATEQRLAQALDAGSIGVFEFDLRDRVFRGDARAVALTGLAQTADGTVPYETWVQAVHPDDRERVAVELQQFAGGPHHDRTHYRIRWADGTEHHLEAAAYTTLDDQGRPRGILGLIVDATERREAERERERLVDNLAERVKELRLLHAVSLLFQDRRTVDRALLEELVAIIPTAWLHAADCRARVVYNDLEVATPGWRPTPWSQSASFNTSDGRGLIQVNYLTSHAAADEGPFLSEERALIDSLASTLRAYIEEQVAEHRRRGLEGQLRQVQKMDALGTLAGGIAHDFNNILTAIIGNAELARSDVPPGSPARQSLDEIVKAYERARDLVRRILLFARRHEAVRTPVAVTPIVQDALGLLGTGLSPRIRIQTTAAADLPVLLADGSQIHQIVMNLGTNAIHAMSDTGGTLSVDLDHVRVADVEELVPGLAPGAYVRLRIRDTGTGMSDEVREHLFEPFFTTKGPSGTGLGLSVVHGIVRDHHGVISVESAPGRGTVFEILLPASGVVANRVPFDPAGAATRGAGQHVMYVDDDQALVLLMSRTLARLGYRCSAFTRPEAALQAFRAHPDGFDAIVTDFQMPGLNGVDLVRAARAIRPSIPAVITSGRIAGDSGGLPLARWMPKPTPPAELSRVLREILDVPAD